MPSAMRYMPLVKPRFLRLNKIVMLNRPSREGDNRKKLRNISLTLVWLFWRAHCLSPRPLASALDSTIPFAKPNLQQQQPPAMKGSYDVWEE